MRLLKILALAILTILVVQYPALAKETKQGLQQQATNVIKCQQPKSVSKQNSSETPIYLAAVNCGFGKTCPDGYNCCRGSGTFFCCPSNKECDETSDACKGTN